MAQKNKIASIEWNSSADNALLSALGEGVAAMASAPRAQQVTVVTGRGPQAAAICRGTGLELPSRNQPHVADGDPDGDGSVDVDELSLE